MRGYTIICFWCYNVLQPIHIILCFKGMLLFMRICFFYWRKVLLINFLTWASRYDLMIMIIRQNDIKQTLALLIQNITTITIGEALNIKWWNWRKLLFFLVPHLRMKNMHILHEITKLLLPNYILKNCHIFLSVALWTLNTCQNIWLQFKVANLLYKVNLLYYKWIFALY